MTVQELIKELSNYDDSLQVKVVDDYDQSLLQITEIIKPTELNSVIIFVEL